MYSLNVKTLRTIMIMYAIFYEKYFDHIHFYNAKYR
ncbi:hypothetical protein SAMN05421797_1011110 [Maribacter ulvicola]|uniref:Uncharacterized protein n=1 Tax=Maribacter ulvicola TaxID=228959 RepID=A0A1N6R2C2_9FLAO|nr:hypothetical protein SAMN05421797_1011110 [Maribacter ulvicola]